MIDSKEIGVLHVLSEESAIRDMDPLHVFNVPGIQEFDELRIVFVYDDDARQLNQFLFVQ